MGRCVEGWTGKWRISEGRDWKRIVTDDEWQEHVLTLHDPFNVTFENAGAGLNNSGAKAEVTET